MAYGIPGWLTVWACGWSMLSGVVAVCMCGDPGRDGLCGFAARLVWGSFWTWLGVLERIVPSCLVRGFANALDYVLNRPNPIFQTGYVIIVYGGYSAFCWYGLGHLPLDSIHRMTHLPVMICCALSFYWACTADPGTIATQESANVQDRLFAYDEMIFYPGVECRTCKIQ